MTTYLQICRDVALECGTVPNPSGKPTTVTGQNGTLARIIGWVNDAYKEVQLSNDRWKWLEARFSNALVQGVANYSASDLGISERFGNWINPGEFPISQERQFTIYKTSLGVSDQSFMIWLPWAEFYEKSQVGANASTTGKPIYVSIDNQENLHVWPTPDAEGWTMGGPYRKSQHTLTADDDLPEFNEQFHDVLRYGALVKLGVFDEAPAQQVNYWNTKYQQYLDDMRARYLPPWQAAGPLV